MTGTTVHLTESQDIYGTNAPDVTVYAGGGDDILFYHGHGTFQVRGGNGNDTVYGGTSGRTIAFGDAGDDILIAGGARSYLNGGTGNDTIVTAAYEAVHNRLMGGHSGHDTFVFEEAHGYAGSSALTDFHLGRHRIEAELDDLGHEINFFTNGAGNAVGRLQLSEGGTHNIDVYNLQAGDVLTVYDVDSSATRDFLVA